MAIVGTRRAVNMAPLMAFLALWLCLCQTTLAQGTNSVTKDGVRWIQYTGNDGSVWLQDERKPSLYTQDFGDCQGGSLINVTRFDAAYYKDNMTVLFHLGGTTALANEDIMRKSIPIDHLHLN
jgi:ML-like domain